MNASTKGSPGPLDTALLPVGVRARIVPGINGLAMHVLEAGHEPRGRPVVLLLHGFPELAWSWRKVIPALAAAGYHVVAPDLRGYGRTTGCDTSFDGDVRQFRMFNLVTDVLGLVRALGRDRVHAVVGHDFGSPLAAWCALARPDVFPAVALMSAPFAGVRRYGVANAEVTNQLTLYGRDRPAVERWTGDARIAGRWRYDDFVTGRAAQDRQLHLNSNFTFRGGWTTGQSVLIETFGYDEELYDGLRTAERGS